MSTEYNATIELDTTEPIDDDLIEAFLAYHPVTARSATRNVEVVITFPADGFIQAMLTAAAVIGRAVPSIPILRVDLITTEEFDRRAGLAPLPPLLSVSEAAELLGVSRQAVLQRIESGSLPGQKIGNAWVVQRESVQRAASAADA